MWRKFHNRKAQALNQPPKDQFRQASLAPTATEQDSRRSSTATEAVHTPDNLGDVNRWPSERSHISKFEVSRDNLNVGLRDARERSQERKKDPLGLTVLFAPQAPRSADIIFIHGLGGTSFQTWSKNRDPELCWPQKWLPLDHEICTARILTFGYNAHFSSTGPNSINGISDFAKALLFDMKYGKNEDSENLGIGDAYVQALNNPDYKDTTANIHAVVFLSTPHRGTNLALILNRILAASIMGHNPKQYISELNKNSSFIEGLNEDFRNVASRLQIFSFYETCETSVAFKSMMVLEKESSVLGYPGEISRPLNADHHDVCKFSSPEDPNYKSVKSALITLVSEHRIANMQRNRVKSAADISKVEELLAVSKAPEEDYIESRDRWEPGTCEGILSNPVFIQWTRPSSTESVLWTYGRPGRASLLRSIAFQVASQLAPFQEFLTGLSNDGLRLDKTDARTIWQKVFVSGLFELQSPRPLYWIIDALDEADSVSIVIEILSSVPAAKLPIRVLITSRELPAITTAFQRVSPPVVRICLDDNADDIKYYAATEMEYMHGSSGFRQDIITRVVEQAEGNFLWVHLAVKQIMQCHSPEDIQQALEALPPGMDALYKRMETSVAGLPRAIDRSLSCAILTWATHARRPLDVKELLSALQPEFSAILDLSFTISQVCGHFVSIGVNNRVTLIHETAREYLINATDLPFSLSSKAAHELLCAKSLSLFLDRNIRSKVSQKTLPPFYHYAATSWAYHLKLTTAASDTILDSLVKFFQGSGILPWIQFLAVVKQLKVLVFTSESLTCFIQKRRKLDAAKMPLLHRLSDLNMLELWAIDLLKIVGKFGNHLLDEPQAIYKFIPQFCPHSSILYRQFGKSSISPLAIRGIANDEWDDCLARISLGGEVQAVLVTCSHRYLAILTSMGATVLWNSVTFEKLRTFLHQEHVFTICFNHSGERFASYGYTTTIIWDIISGRQILNVTNVADTRALCMAFTENDTVLIIGADTRKVQRLRIDRAAEGWEPLDKSIMQEDTSLEGTFLNSPTALAFNGDVTELAVAYRGFPLSVWSLGDAQLINRCRRRVNHGGIAGKAWTGVNRVVWHPNSGEVLGIYTDGMVFRWHPIEESHQELNGADLNATPSEIQCSPDGVVFATSDVNGSIKLYNFHHFTLIYQLSSEDIVSALCFSPDGQRFYDLRGPYCNVWEPNALIRLSSTDEEANEIETEIGSTAMSYLASEAFVGTPVSITALALRPQGELVCTGDDEGTVEVLDVTRGEKQEVSSSVAGLSIEHIAFAEEGTIFVFAELAGKITAVKIEEQKGENAHPRWRTHPIMSIKSSLETGGIQQLLISPDADLFLVSSMNSAQLWSIGTKSIQNIFMSTTPGVPHQWLNHPLNSGQLLSFTPTEIQAHDWGTLQELNRWHLNLPRTIDINDDEAENPSLPRKNSTGNPLSTSEDDRSIDNILISPTKALIFLSISQRTSFATRPSQLQIIETASFNHLDPDPQPILPTSLPPEIASVIGRPLAVLGRDRLLFLDHSFWVCTWNLKSAGATSAKGLVRHFFLPRDWVNAENLELCRIMSDGTFLCHRKGEIAILSSTLQSSW
ncbi:MAG: hypothetical protein Q9187_000671 [Circinaria calcarea]